MAYNKLSETLASSSRDMLNFHFFRKGSGTLIILAKFFKNILQLLTGLQFDICYIIKTGFEIAEITGF